MPSKIEPKYPVGDIIIPIRKEPINIVIPFKEQTEDGITYPITQSERHHYPCRNHLEERSCTECRQIADERSYWSKKDWKDYRKEQYGNPPNI